MKPLSRSAAQTVRVLSALPYPFIRIAHPSAGALATIGPDAHPAGLDGAPGSHLQEGIDEEVLRMQPYALAETWHGAPREVLRLFLYATKVGLLEVEPMCPNCRVPKRSTTPSWSLRHATTATCAVSILRRISSATSNSAFLSIPLSVRP